MGGRIFYDEEYRKAVMGAVCGELAEDVLRITESDVEQDKEVNWGDAFAILVEIGVQFEVSVGMEYDSGYRVNLANGSDGEPQLIEGSVGWTISVGEYSHSTPYKNPWEALQDGFKIMWDYYVEGNFEDVEE